MRKLTLTAILLFVFTLSILYAQDFDIPALDTARDVDYLSDVEKDIILETNMVRSNPRRYAELYLRQGSAAYNELRRSQPRSILHPKRGLTLAARDHAEDVGSKGITGHYGSDGSSPFVRAMRHGDGIAGKTGENINYGRDSVRENIVSWLNSAGHRRNIMDRDYRFIGVASGSHSVYGIMFVQVFSSDYLDNEEIIAIEAEKRANSERPEAEARAEYPNGNLPDDYFQLIDTTEYRVVRGSTEPPRAVVIPETFNGLPVTEISHTFSRYNDENASILVVYIPQSVRSINLASFAACSNLAVISIPESVTSIGSIAFSGCYNLTRVTFEGVISPEGFAPDAFPGDLRAKYLDGGAGTYTRERSGTVWTKQE